MLTFKEHAERLLFAYSVTCPICGAQWRFSINSRKGCIEHRTCNHKEYTDLIEKRLKDFEDQLKDGDK